MSSRPCPTHPRFPVDDCPLCEKKIARAEAAEADPPTDWQTGTTLYERQLERQQP